jgi:hypothetical protein
VPDNQGKLSPEEDKALTQWIIDHWKTVSCPFHGPTHWEIGWATATQPYAAALGMPGTGTVLGGAAFPLALLTCAECGYVVFINLIKAGIATMPRPEPQPSPPTTSDPAAGNEDG